MATKKVTSNSPLMRAKFSCISLDKNEDENNPFEHPHFAPVVGDGSTENESFSKFTPSGSLEMTITNPSLFGKINPGDVFYLDFIPVHTEED